MLRQTLLRHRLRGAGTCRDAHRRKPPPGRRARWPRRRRLGIAQRGMVAQLTQFDALGHMPPCHAADTPAPHCPAYRRRRGKTMRRDTAARADAMLDLAPASRYSWPTRGSMDMFAERFRLPGIHSIALEPISEPPVAPFPALLGPGVCVGWQPAVDARRSLTTRLTEPPPSGFVMPVVTMASAAPRSNRREERVPGNTASPRVPSTDIRCRVGTGNDPTMLNAPPPLKTAHDTH